MTVSYCIMVSLQGAGRAQSLQESFVTLVMFGAAPKNTIKGSVCTDSHWDSVQRVTKALRTCACDFMKHRCADGEKMGAKAAFVKLKQALDGTREVPDPMGHDTG